MFFIHLCHLDPVTLPLSSCGSLFRWTWWHWCHNVCTKTWGWSWVYASATQLWQVESLTAIKTGSLLLSSSSPVFLLRPQGLGLALQSHRGPHTPSLASVPTKTSVCVCVCVCVCVVRGDVPVYSVGINPLVISTCFQAFTVLPPLSLPPSYTHFLSGGLSVPALPRSHPFGLGVIPGVRGGSSMLNLWTRRFVCGTF